MHCQANCLVELQADIERKDAAVSYNNLHENTNRRRRARRTKTLLLQRSKYDLCRMR